MSLSQTTKKTKRVNTKGKKKSTENKVSISVDSILPFELSYDMSVDDEFKSSLLERDMTIHMDIISKLPTFKVDFKTKSDEEEHNEKKNKKAVRIKQPVVEENDEDEYMKNLPIEKVGNAQYKFDYDKGIIYDMKDCQVGHIDSYGEICINGEEPNEDDNSNLDDENI
jgi:hypothetical protein